MNLSESTRRIIWDLVVNYQTYFSFILLGFGFLFYLKRGQLSSLTNKFISQSEKFFPLSKYSILKMTLFALLFVLYIISNSHFHFSSSIKFVLSSLYLTLVLFFCEKEISCFFTVQTPINGFKKRILENTVFCWCTTTIIVVPAIWVYHLFNVPFNAQGLGNLPDVSIGRWIEINVYGIPNVVSEEIFNLLVLLIFSSLLTKLKRPLALIVSAILMSVVFGLLHIFAWNPVTAISIFLSHITIALFFIYIRDIKPLIFCHIINNLIATSVITGMSVLIKPILLLPLTIPMLYSFVLKQIHLTLEITKEK